MSAVLQSTRDLILLLMRTDCSISLLETCVVVFVCPTVFSFSNTYGVISGTLICSHCHIKHQPTASNKRGSPQGLHSYRSLEDWSICCVSTEELELTVRTNSQVFRTDLFQSVIKEYGRVWRSRALARHSLPTNLAASELMVMYGNFGKRCWLIIRASRCLGTLHNVFIRLSYMIEKEPKVTELPTPRQCSLPERKF
jgi:hypothetical protein